MSALWQDILYGLRMLAKKPVFTLVAALSLALGIGLNTAIFTLMNTILLAPLRCPWSSRSAQRRLGSRLVRMEGAVAFI
jgi:putative ABC transport system permease protein